MHTSAHSAPSASSFARQRANMMDNLLRPQQVQQAALLHAMAAVAREAFLPPQHHAVAYADQPITIAPSRVMLSPVVLARLVQMLNVTPADDVLIIGAGAGEAVAVLAQLAGTVLALEDEPALCTSLTTHFAHQPNIALQALGPHQLSQLKQPFSKVLVLCPLPAVPEGCLNLLTHQGAMAALVVGAGGVLQGTHITRVGNALLHEALFDTPTLPLHPALVAAPAFVF
jgi:protein-L-isoaspartate(D-aspartate) O-methyltransferase